jgi:hypothetical protein
MAARREPGPARPVAFGSTPMAEWTPPQVPPRLVGASPSVAASSNTHVPDARIMFCVLAMNDDPRANHDATYGGAH